MSVLVFERIGCGGRAMRRRGFRTAIPGVGTAVWMIDLTDDEFLVLFDCLHRMCETGRIAVGHSAEVAVLDKIA